MSQVTGIFHGKDGALRVAGQYNQSRCNRVDVQRRFKVTQALKRNLVQVCVQFK